MRSVTEKTRQVRAQRHAQGLCWYCPQPITPGSSGCCLWHVLHKRTLQRGRQGSQAWQPGRAGRPPLDVRNGEVAA